VSRGSATASARIAGTASAGTAVAKLSTRTVAAAPATYASISVCACSS
jgi:hypothetical protein